MALLLYVEKKFETEDLVVYAFGEDFNNFTRELRIDKASRVPCPGDGEFDRQFYDAARKVLGLERERGHWPGRGMLAS